MKFALSTYLYLAPLNAFENELEVDWSYTTPVDLGDAAVDGLETSRSAREAALAKNSSKVRSVLCVANDKMMNTLVARYGVAGRLIVLPLMELRRLKRLSTVTDLVMNMGIASFSAAFSLTSGLAAGYEGILISQAWYAK